MNTPLVYPAHTDQPISFISDLFATAARYAMMLLYEGGSVRSSEIYRLYLPSVIVP